MKGTFTFIEHWEDIKKLSPDEIKAIREFNKERKLQIYEEQECTFNQCLREGIDTFKFELLTNEPLHSIYRDMAPQYTRFYDRVISATYLFVGIQRQDSWMSQQIQLRDKSKYKPKNLAKMIRCNYHLHNIIKTNLLNNLKNYSGFDGMKE